MKKKCDRCKTQTAVWWYMPSEHDSAYCDDCVPRGCSCNINVSTGIEDTDTKGRFFPCCEYGYDEDGIDE